MTKGEFVSAVIQTVWFTVVVSASALAIGAALLLCAFFPILIPLVAAIVYGLWG